MTTSELRTSRPWSERSGLVRLCQVALLAGFLVVWQLYADHSRYGIEVFSSPAKVAKVLGHWAVGSGSRWGDLLSTLQGAALGFLLGGAAATLLTLLFVTVPFVAKLFGGYVAAFNAIPKVVIAPLFVLWFGLGLESKTLFVASVIFIVMFYNIYIGVRSIDPIFARQARVLGAHRLWELREVLVPAMVSRIVVSLRVSVAFALLSSVISEYLGANKGIGHLISDGQSTLESNEVLAGVVVVGIVTIILDWLLRAVEARFSRWRSA